MQTLRQRRVIIFRQTDAALRFSDILADFHYTFRMDKLLWHDVVAPGQHFHVARKRIRGTNARSIHMHDFAEVFWVEEGSGTHLINDQPIPLPMGSIVLIRPADAHGFRCDDEHGFTLVNVAFPCNTLEFLCEHYSFGERFFWVTSELPWHNSVDAVQLTWLSRTADEMAAMMSQRLHIDRFLLNLLHEFGATHNQSRLPADSDCPDWVRQVLTLVAQPEHFALGVRHVACLVNRSPEHVTRVLQKYVGMRTSEVVNRARLDYAARQLQMKSASIVEISLACGFNSLAHFYQLFRARYGVTPREYRMRQQSMLR